MKKRNYCYMSIGRWIVCTLSVLCNTALAAEFEMQCYSSQHKGEISIIGVTHIFLPSESYREEFRKTISKHNIVLLENTEVMPPNGIFGASQVNVPFNNTTFNIKDFVSKEEVSTISELLQINFNDDALLPEHLFVYFPDVIMSKKFLHMGIKREHSFKKAANRTTLESFSYATALQLNIPVYGLETAKEAYGLASADKDGLKAEIRAALDCINNSQCLNAHLEALDYMDRSEKMSYEEALAMTSRMPSFVRYTMKNRNSLHSKKILSHATKETRILAILGAAHISGEEGIAKKIENAGFTRTECNLQK